MIVVRGSLFLIGYLLLLPVGHGQAAESICFGTTSKGRLENGVKLPSGGSNFVGYSSVARFAGRTYVHSKVRDVLLSSYQTLAAEMPDKVYKYAETGFENGGKFKPHKTHQNGLSVDFMTPVTDANGKSVHLPTHPFNRFGYDIEFKGDQYDGLRIDYEAMAAHIVALHKASLAAGIDIWRVIFDPRLTPNLYKTKHGSYLKKHITFSKRRSWVRHDEHYHVDFRLNCKPLGQ